MSILCIGDIHIKTNNTHLVDLLEHQIVEHVQNKGIELVILLGDILDTFERIHTQALNRAYQLIDSIRQHAKLYILVGNHDYINNQQFLTNQHWMNALKDWKNVVVVDTVIIYQNMLFVPYVPVKRFAEALETQSQIDWKTASYIFAHQEFKGCKMGAIISSEGDEWELEWPMIISGHIHDRQQPQKNIYYIGASLQNSFGDQTLPILLWIEPHTNTHTELVLDLPRKKTVYTNIENIQELDLQQDIQQMIEQKNIDMIRIVVKCEYEQFKVFSQTKYYEMLQSHTKCKIVHKLPEPERTQTISDTNSGENSNSYDSVDSAINPEPTGSNSNLNSNSNSIEWFDSSTFDKWLYNKVLQTKDSYVYSTYNEIIHDTTIEPEDILIV